MAGAREFSAAVGKMRLAFVLWENCDRLRSREGYAGGECVTVGRIRVSISTAMCVETLCETAGRNPVLLVLWEPREEGHKFRSCLGNLTSETLSVNVKIKN